MSTKMKSAKKLAEDGGASLFKSLHGLSLQPSSLPNGHADSSSDICPVCKSSRYLNPNMQFKVNPECYHKMCESCVDRIFSHGPAPCPIAGCARTLRKAKFRTQTFEDLKVEREVDIRRRVAHA
jgi:CDK-activating kinase assembly factor MAT1